MSTLRAFALGVAFGAVVMPMALYVGAMLVGGLLARAHRRPEGAP